MGHHGAPRCEHAIDCAFPTHWRALRAEAIAGKLFQAGLLTLVGAVRRSCLTDGAPRSTAWWSGALGVFGRCWWSGADPGDWIGRSLSFMLRGVGASGRFGVGSERLTGRFAGSRRRGPLRRGERRRLRSLARQRIDR